MIHRLRTAVYIAVRIAAPDHKAMTYPHDLLSGTYTKHTPHALHILPTYAMSTSGIKSKIIMTNTLDARIVTIATTLLRRTMHAYPKIGLDLPHTQKPLRTYLTSTT